MVAADRARCGSVVGISLDRRTVRLRIERLGDVNAAGRPAAERANQPNPLTVAELKATIGRSKLEGVLAITDDSRELPIVGSQEWVRETGAGGGSWLMLLPSAVPEGARAL